MAIAVRRSLLSRVGALNRAEQLLGLLILIGVLMRILAMVTVWPTIPVELDSNAYAAFAAHDPLGDFQHPAGYSLFLALIGLVTRQIVAFMVIQHLAGLASGVLLFAAVRRFVGSPWPGLLAAAFVLLNADQIYQEQSVMSEWLFTFLLSLGLYATARAIDRGGSRLKWALVAGVLAGLAIVVRTDGILLPVIFAIVVFVGAPRPRRVYGRVSVALLGAAAAVLVVYGVAKDIDTGHFEVGPSPGWQLYATVAPFANCKLFTPPKGSAGLCQNTSPSQRPGHDFYLYEPQSPAVELFGRMGNQDGLVGAWARDALLASPGRYLTVVYHTFRTYFIPSAFTPIPYSGYPIDVETNWHLWVGSSFQHGIVTQIEQFFAPFHVSEHPRREEVMRAYQVVFRFGGAVLTISTLLMLLGVAIGPARARLGVFAFGATGLAILIPPSLAAVYIGRYQVPVGGAMGAAAGITLWTVWRMERARRDAVRG